jgi:peptide/nickel transport system permease protein
MAAANRSVDSSSPPDTRPQDAQLLRGVRRLMRELFSYPLSAVGVLIVSIFLILALFGPAIAPYTENDQSHPSNHAPDAEYPFGTDYLGRDVYSRVILGARSILVTAGAGTLVAVILGTFLGLAIGYYGGWIDEVAGRFIDAVLALPALLIALVMLGVLRNVDASPGSWQALFIDRSVLIVIAFVYVPLVARVVRSSTLDVKTREFIWAAQMRGESLSYILFREILPSVTPALVVEASLRFSYAIFLVASLGFLGVGASPPSPDWGLMVSENRGGRYLNSPWALNYPALAIAVLVVGVNLLSDTVKRFAQRSR